MMCDCKNNNTSCNTCQEKRCSPKPLCDCPAGYMSSDCINNVTANFECTLIESGLTLTETLEQMDLAICEIVNSIGAGSNVLVNVGAGSQLYKGIDLLGRKEIKSLTKVGDLITITPNTDDVGIGIDEEALIQLITDNSTGGDFTGNNLGFGAKVYKDTIAFTHNFRTLTSKTLSIVESPNGEEIEINISEITQIPALYVNNLFIPTYEDWLAENTKQNVIPVAGFQYRGVGTISKPFTDTTIYPLGGGVRTGTVNTAIQNAIDGSTLYGYVGTGTRLNPQRRGQQIIVQDNSSSYVYSGDLNYSDLNIKIESNAIFTTTTLLVDLDNGANFNVNNSSVKLEIQEGRVLEVTQSLGFNNSGNASITNSYATAKTVELNGNGLITFTYNGSNNLTKYIFNGEGNNNDGNLHYIVRCQVRAIRQGVYFSKNKNRMDVYNLMESGIFSGSVDTNLKAFHLTGGEIRLFGDGTLSINSETSGRLYGITFQPMGAGIGNSIMSMINTTLTYNCNFTFVKLNDENVRLSVVNTVGGGSNYVAGTSPSTTVNGLFKNLGTTKWQVEFKNNRFPYTGINFDEVDLTMGNTSSSSNHIGNNLVETLVVYNNRKNAILAGIPLYSAFLSRNEIGRSEGTELNPYPNTSNWIRDIVLPV